MSRLLHKALRVRCLATRTSRIGSGGPQLADFIRAAALAPSSGAAPESAKNGANLPSVQVPAYLPSAVLAAEEARSFYLETYGCVLVVC